MHRRLALATLLAFSLAACGEDDPTGPDGGGNNTFSASVDGQSMNVSGAAVTAARNGNVLAIGATQTSGGTTTLVTITLTDVTGTGTFQLNPNFAGQFGQVTRSGGGTNSSWTTVLAPGTGSVTITNYAADRITGTFQFTGQAAPGTAATGQLSVTSGNFDLRF
jgi:hypothetical protein